MRTIARTVATAFHTNRRMTESYSLLIADC
jgi:hypothetical protein